MTPFTALLPWTQRRVLLSPETLARIAMTPIDYIPRLEEDLTMDVWGICLALRIRYVRDLVESKRPGYDRHEIQHDHERTKTVHVSYLQDRFKGLEGLLGETDRLIKTEVKFERKDNSL